MLTEAQLLDMSGEQRAEAAKAAIVNACRKLMKRDLILLAIGAHEQAICHRLAVYLEQFAALNVDCEYNRQRVHPKSIGGSRIKPDILIHKRMDNRFNIMVLEAKAGAKTSLRDKEKLEAMLEQPTAHSKAGAAEFKFALARWLGSPTDERPHLYGNASRNIYPTGVRIMGKRFR